MPFITKQSEIEEIYQHNKENNLVQISIDLGSSRYAIVYKECTADAMSINLNGDQTNEKSSNVAFIEMHSIINQEKVEPQDVTFSCQNSKFAQNMAMLPNWKNFFFESSAHVKYPETPTMPSMNNRSARVRVSCLYEAFFFQCLQTIRKKLTNQSCKNYIVALLIPSLAQNHDNDKMYEQEHEQFLVSCFQETCKLYGDLNICFLLKKEAIAASIQYICKQEKFKRFNKSFVLADIGGYTTDIANVAFEDNKYTIEVRSINIAGNNINSIISNMLRLQFPDLTIRDYYKLHQCIDQIKHSNEFEIDNFDIFDNISCCSYVLQLISECFNKLIHQILNKEQFSNVISLMYPFIERNMENDVSTTIQQIQQDIEKNLFNQMLLIQKFSNIILKGQAVLDAKPTVQDIRIWIFVKLLPNAKRQCCLNLINYFKAKQYDSIYLQERKILILELQNKLEKNSLGNKKMDNKSNQYALDEISIKLCYKIRNLLPLLKSFKEFELYVEQKEIEANIKYNAEYMAFKQVFSTMKSNINNIYNMASCEFIQIALKQYFSLDNIWDESVDLINAENEYLQQQFSKSNLKQYDQIMNEELQLFNYSIHQLEKIFKQEQVKCKKQRNVNNFVDACLKQQHPHKILQGIILFCYTMYDCCFLKQHINSFTQKSLNTINIQEIVTCIELKEHTRFCLNYEVYERVVSSVCYQICQEIDDFEKTVVISGGFANHCEFTQKYGSKVLDDCDLAYGGIYELQRNNIVVSQCTTATYCIKFEKDVQSSEAIISFEPLLKNRFKENKVCIDQGTGGSQGFYAWVNNTYDSLLIGQPCAILEDPDKRRLQNTIAPPKMPSFAIFNTEKFNVYCKFQGQKSSENIKIMLCQNFYQLQQSDIMNILSFESFEYNQYGLEQPQQKQKSKLKKVENRVNFSNSRNRLIFSWKKKLYSCQKPEFPLFPCIQQVISINETEINIQIPLSLLFISQLLFFKQKYNTKFKNEGALCETSYMLTVPCGANVHHLHFVRCCAKAAGLGDNISFVFEPISAMVFTIYKHIQQNSSQKDKDNKIFNPKVLAGNYLIIDVGSGTTDVAYATVNIIEQSVQELKKFHQYYVQQQLNQEGKQVIADIKTHQYTSIIKAGDDVDLEIQNKIKIFSLIPKDVQGKEAKCMLQLSLLMDTCKRSLKDAQVDSSFTCQLMFESEDSILEIAKQMNLIGSEVKESESCIEVSHDDYKAYKYQLYTQLKMLKFVIPVFTIQSALNTISIDILKSVIDFMKNIKLKAEEIRVLCTGGIGGSFTFKKQTLQMLYGQSWPTFAKVGQTEFEFIDSYEKLIILEELHASNSIACGGVFLSGEKDYINFDVEIVLQTDLNEAQVLQQLDVNDQILWKLDQTSQMFQSSETCSETQLIELGLSGTLVEYNYKQCKLEYVGQYLQCTAGWDGIAISIIFKKKRKTQQLSLHFTTEQIRSVCEFELFSPKLFVVKLFLANKDYVVEQCDQNGEQHKILSKRIVQLKGRLRPRKGYFQSTAESAVDLMEVELLGVEEVE